MAFYLVEECPSVRKAFWGWSTKDERGKSEETVPLTVWRCSNCKKLCCAMTGTSPPALCGFCGQR